jgi:hypothetical protein
MFSIDNFQNRFKILVALHEEGLSHVYVRVIDKVNYSIFALKIDNLFLQNLMVCQNHQQLNAIIINAFKNVRSSVKINITDVCTMNIKSFFIDAYCSEFKLVLEEQQQTTDKKNQAMILELMTKIESMEKRMETQENLLSKASMAIGSRPDLNGQIHVVHVPLGTESISIAWKVISNANINKQNLDEGNPYTSPGSTIQVENPFWSNIANLPNLRTLFIDTGLPNWKLEQLVSPTLNSLTVDGYQHATMESLEKFTSLATLVIRNSPNLKSLHLYLPPQLNSLTISGCQPLMEAEKPMLDDICQRRNIILSMS